MHCYFPKAAFGRTLALGLAVLCAGSVAAAPPEKLLPDNTTMVFAFNMKAFTESALFQKALRPKMEELMQQNQQFVGIMKSMNLDPMRDINSITVAIGDFNLNMQGGPPQPDVEPFVIVKGNFDVAKIETAAQALISAGGGDKVSVSKMGERTLFEIREGNKPMFASFIDKETMAIADSKESLQHVVDRSEGRKATKLTKEMETAWSKVDSKRTFVMAMILPDSIKQMAGMTPQGAIVEKIESINLTVNVRENLDIEMNAYTSDADSANEFKSMLDQAKEMMGILALNAPDEADSRDLGDFLSSIRIAASGKVVSMKGELKGGMIERAVKNIPSGGN